MKAKLSFGDILFCSCLICFTILFLMLGTLAAMQDSASTRDTRLLLSLGIIGTVISGYWIYGATLNKVFLLPPLVGVLLSNTLGFVSDCDLQVFTYVIAFFFSLTDFGIYYVRRWYSRSGALLSEGSASKWEGWKYNSGATTVWGVIWWKLKETVFFVVVFGALAGLVLWVSAGSSNYVPPDHHPIIEKDFYM